MSARKPANRLFIDDDKTFASDHEDRRDKSWEKRTAQSRRVVNDTSTAHGDSDERDELEELRYNPRMRGPVPKETLRRCAALVDSVGIPELLDEWDRLEHDRRKGGRPAAIPMRAVLILWLVLAWEHQPLQLKRIGSILSERLSPKRAEMLGITFDPSVTPDAWYERARRATDRLLGLIDYLPVFDLTGRRNRYRRLLKREWDNVLARREEDAERLADRACRADILMNRLLEATYLLLPVGLRQERVSVTIDATAVRVHARGIGRERVKRLSAGDKMSIEPDAAFWARHTEDHADDGKTPLSKLKYGFELELGVLTSNDPNLPDDIPHIVLGIGHHAPGAPGPGPGGAARRMFQNIIDRGHQLHFVIGDRAYLPGAKSSDLQDFLREHRAMLVMDYHKNFLGLQDSYAGAIMVDGNWYCQTMPEELINASRKYREAEDADKEDTALTKVERNRRAEARRRRWEADVEARMPYMFSPKGGPKEQGQRPWMCPAYAGTASCARKTTTRLPDGAIPLTVIVNPPTGRVLACDNITSITIPASAGSKFAQHFQYGSKEWRAVYAHGRNSVESFNAYLKDGSTHALEDGSRRRLRGAAAQYLLATLLVVAANLDKIADFANLRTEEGIARANGHAASPGSLRKKRRTTPHQRVAHTRGRAGAKESSRGRKRNPVRT